MESQQLKNLDFQVAIGKDADTPVVQLADVGQCFSFLPY